VSFHPSSSTLREGHHHQCPSSLSPSLTSSAHYHRNHHKYLNHSQLPIILQPSQKHHHVSRRSPRVISILSLITLISLSYYPCASLANSVNYETTNPVRIVSWDDGIEFRPAIQTSPSAISSAENSAEVDGSGNDGGGGDSSISSWIPVTTHPDQGVTSSFEVISGHSGISRPSSSNSNRQQDSSNQVSVQNQNQQQLNQNVSPEKVMIWFNRLEATNPTVHEWTPSPSRSGVRRSSKSGNVVAVGRTTQSFLSPVQRYSTRISPPPPPPPTTTTTTRSPETTTTTERPDRPLPIRVVPKSTIQPTSSLSAEFRDDEGGEDIIVGRRPESSDLRSPEISSNDHEDLRSTYDELSRQAVQRSSKTRRVVRKKGKVNTNSNFRTQVESESEKENENERLTDAGKGNVASSIVHSNLNGYEWSADIDHTNQRPPNVRSSRPVIIPSSPETTTSPASSFESSFEREVEEDSNRSNDSNESSSSSAPSTTTPAPFSRLSPFRRTSKTNPLRGTTTTTKSQNLFYQTSSPSTTTENPTTNTPIVRERLTKGRSSSNLQRARGKTSARRLTDRLVDFEEPGGTTPLPTTTTEVPFSRQVQFFQYKTEHQQQPQQQLRQQLQHSVKSPITFERKNKAAIVDEDRSSLDYRFPADEDSRETSTTTTTRAPSSHTTTVSRSERLQGSSGKINPTSSGRLRSPERTPPNGKTAPRRTQKVVVQVKVAPIRATTTRAPPTTTLPPTTTAPPTAARLQSGTKGRHQVRGQISSLEVEDDDNFSGSNEDNKSKFRTSDFNKKSGVQIGLQSGEYFGNQNQVGQQIGELRDDRETESVEGGENPENCRLEDSIPGTPLTDYPTFSAIPNTTFKCSDHSLPGYYGDVEAQCQVFHVCQHDGRRSDFLCPVGTIFNQELFVCDWWQNFRCQDTVSFYRNNELLYNTLGGTERERETGNLMFSQLRRRTGNPRPSPDSIEREGEPTDDGLGDIADGDGEDNIFNTERDEDGNEGEKEGRTTTSSFENDFNSGEVDILDNEPNLGNNEGRSTTKTSPSPIYATKTTSSERATSEWTSPAAAIKGRYTETTSQQLQGIKTTASITDRSRRYGSRLIRRGKTVGGDSRLGGLKTSFRRRSNRLTSEELEGHDNFAASATDYEESLLSQLSQLDRAELSQLEKEVKKDDLMLSDGEGSVTSTDSPSTTAATTMTPVTEPSPPVDGTSTVPYTPPISEVTTENTLLRKEESSYYPNHYHEKQSSPVEVVKNMNLVKMMTSALPLPPPGM